MLCLLSEERHHCLYQRQSGLYSARIFLKNFTVCLSRAVPTRAFLPWKTLVMKNTCTDPWYNGRQDPLALFRSSFLHDLSHRDSYSLHNMIDRDVLQSIFISPLLRSWFCGHLFVTGKDPGQGMGKTRPNDGLYYPVSDLKIRAIIHTILAV